jgi:hypothetical protein
LAWPTIREADFNTAAAITLPTVLPRRSQILCDGYNGKDKNRIWIVHDNFSLERRPEQKVHQNSDYGDRGYDLQDEV